MGKRATSKGRRSDRGYPLAGSGKTFKDPRAARTREADWPTSSEEANQLVEDVNKWRRTADMLPGHQCILPLSAQEAQAEIAANLAIQQARKRSKLAIQMATQLATRTRRQRHRTDTQTDSVSPSEFEAFMLARPQLAVEIRFLSDQSLHRSKQHSMRELYRHFLERAQASQDVAGGEDPLRAIVSYQAFSAWVRRARIANGEGAQ